MATEVHEAEVVVGAKFAQVCAFLLGQGLGHHDLDDALRLDDRAEVVEMPEDFHSEAVGVEEMAVEHDEACDLLAGGAVDVGGEEVAVEAGHRGDADNGGERWFLAVGKRAGVPSGLRVPEKVHEESLQKNERDRDAGGVGVEAVDVGGGEQEVAGAGDEESEDQGAAEAEIVVGGGVVPEDAVGAGTAEDGHQDGDVAQQAGSADGDASGGDEISDDDAEQVPERVDGVGDEDARVGALEIVVEDFRGVPEFDEGQSVQDEGEGSQNDDHRHQQVVAGQEAADDSYDAQTEGDGVDVQDGLALVVLEMPQKAVVHVALVRLAQTFNQT